MQYNIFYTSGRRRTQVHDMGERGLDGDHVVAVEAVRLVRRAKAVGGERGAGHGAVAEAGGVVGAAVEEEVRARRSLHDVRAVSFNAVYGDAIKFSYSKRTAAQIAA